MVPDEVQVKSVRLRLDLKFGNEIGQHTVLPSTKQREWIVYYFATIMTVAYMSTFWQKQNILRRKNTHLFPRFADQMFH